MSDSDSASFSPPRSSNSQPRRTLTDFPLSDTTALRTTVRDLNRTLRRVQGVANQLAGLTPPGFATTGLPLRIPLENPDTPVDNSQTLSGPAFYREELERQMSIRRQSLLMAREAHNIVNSLPSLPPVSGAPTLPSEQAKTKAALVPVVTLVPMLPKTTYKDEDDTKGTPKTLAYAMAQLAVLKYLDRHASDSLSPYQARKWTQAIELTSKEPKAEEALRLCYYMRSQGYDTGAIIEQGAKSILLYVANPHSTPNKMPYWKQDTSTNQVQFMAPSPLRQPRRNALAGNPFGFGQPFAQNAGPPATHAQAIQAAQVRLEAALAGSDPEAINAALTTLEALNAQEAAVRTAAASLPLDHPA
ncbi:hypothetical protein FB567DRAFT_97682 [Paraphoma chrysanthemicola]|uniref:Uncharacterized protein n=1 Tax=Paraphoma chrysanthemicola TaxID=798071 RepID=A0A8K0VW16_9PLEO|nr:hypothetical protein FB567DRAFT_97682 [Paraphoma chrysanthemicola]